MEPSHPPHVSEPPKKPKGLIFVVLGVGLPVVVLGAFIAIWQFLAPTDRRVPVAYSDFLAEVHAGRVEEIRVHDRDIDYRLAPDPNAPKPGSALMRHTVGPVPDQAFLDSLKPTDPNAVPPRIHFEK
jgi:cell division protease FtsH